ncbi:family 43 glycosylhydrolase [Hymenobacter cellulosilyticus]|uniref:Family 43 glycosylhydrolase n=1 Tax=Hymenobacter cellulosilyticus TaxID=2932248 RepID=A0A8T9Q9H4_9BACT|nr:family 43 glycosylhydrolase [Hymenobacter cellulosilyticus]UOQ74187.1 family 43 glycosylhydrolase [Hymenobacter cellulosilyticus]
MKNLLLLVCLLLSQLGGRAQTPAAGPVKKTVKDFPHTGEPPMPPVKPILDTPLRDASICLGPDKTYYLTGTIGPDFMVSNEGIKVWKSKDMKTWEPLGLVWSIERDGTWQKQWTVKNGNRRRALWAPKSATSTATSLLPTASRDWARVCSKAPPAGPKGPT